MTQEQLTRLLHERTADEPVGPPPLTDIHRAVVRRRRGRLAVLAAAACVVLLAGTLTVLDRPAPDDDGPAPATTRPATDPDLPPAGYRWVGVGHAAIAVPEGWGTNATTCGTPTRDTVVVNQGAICLAAVPFPAETSSVEVRSTYDHDERGRFADIEVDGERGLLSPVQCSQPGDFGAASCGQSLLLPDRDVVFEARTSRGRAALAPILDRVAILEHDVAVPAYALIADDLQADSGEAYVAALTKAGLRARVVTQVLRHASPGYVLDASPAPGTVVEPGTTVTVTQVAGRAGPADEVVLAFNSEKDDEYRSLDDSQVRTDPTLRVEVGTHLWTYAEGKRQRAVEVMVDGGAIEEEAGNGQTKAWVAARPGTSAVELALRVDQDRLVLGTVTVVVE